MLCKRFETMAYDASNVLRGEVKVPHLYSVRVPVMIFGVSTTKDAVVIAQATGPGETFVIKSIKSIQFQA